ncbi:cyclodeaminase/cyclohydrolase family protein [Halomonas sp. WWR20]
MPISSSVWDMTLGAFRNAVVARAAPGCGAAAAAAADIGLALVMKGLDISQSKQYDAQRAALIERARPLLDTLGEYADRDMAAFEDFLQAARLPQDSESQSQYRDRAIAEAGVRINEIPLATAEACLEGLLLAAECLPLTAVKLRSDTVAGAFLLHSGLSSVLLNVDANLASLDDPAQREQARHARQALQQAADDKLQWLKQADVS